jgi:hypothetical protein
LLGSDIAPIAPNIRKADCRNLPYKTASIDIVVLDPPYIHHTARHITDRRYDKLLVTKNMTHAEIRVAPRGHGRGQTGCSSPAGCSESKPHRERQATSLTYHPRYLDYHIVTLPLAPLYPVARRNRRSPTITKGG